ncbi:ESX secretion-associated protein EspG [Rhodococcus sp. ABRD24]|uniref:ESX secretion-associated protein EspG n=1 Tax=Rhodococcus sp. ABRD24 TaxID=2507582 RepID=UPI001F61E2F4|nr:ESX secretion-associated protein EspG [Rhodococcus sp. ABRD24]
MGVRIAGDRPMSGGSWRFTGLEFQVLWAQLGRDRLPYPLRFRPIADTQDDLDRQRRAAARQWAPRVTETLHRHLNALAEPAVRVEVCGYAGAGLDAKVRMHAGIRGASGALAIQLPGVDDDTGGDIYLHCVAPAQLAHAIVAALPAAPAGTRRPLTFRRADLDSGGGPILVSAGSTRTRDEVNGFFRRPRTGIGEITAFAGVAYDSRPTEDGIGLHWLDFADDGRYSVRGVDNVVAAPVSAADLASEIARLMARVQARAARC